MSKSKTANTTAPVVILEMWSEQSDHLYRLADFLPGAAVAVGEPEQAAQGWPTSQKIFIQAGKAATNRAFDRLFRELYGAQWKAVVLFDLKAEIKMLTEAEQRNLFIGGDVFPICDYQRFDGFQAGQRQSAQDFTRRTQVSGPVNLRFFRLARGEYARCGVAFINLKDKSGMSVPCVYFRGATYWRGSVEIWRVYREYQELTKDQFRALRGRGLGGQAVA